MILSDALCRHRDALRASLRAEYRLDLSSPDIPWFDVADLVAWLPAGSALWVSYGGPTSVSVEAELLRWIDYRLRVLVWSKTKDAKDGRGAPTPPKKLKLAKERDEADVRTSVQAAAYARRQEIREAQKRGKG